MNAITGLEGETDDEYDSDVYDSDSDDDTVTGLEGETDDEYDSDDEINAAEEVDAANDDEIMEAANETLEVLLAV